MSQLRWRKFGQSWRAFAASGHLRVGVVVEVGPPKKDRRETPKDLKFYLVGDVNQNRGTCNDCTAFEADDVVYRYVEALSEDDLVRLCGKLTGGE